MAENTAASGSSDAVPWTAGQLRKALEGVPGDLPVTVLTAEDHEQVITSAGPWAHVAGTADDVRTRLRSGELRADHFEIGLEWRSDEYEDECEGAPEGGTDG